MVVLGVLSSLCYAVGICMERYIYMCIVCHIPYNTMYVVVLFTYVTSPGNYMGTDTSVTHIIYSV